MATLEIDRVVKQFGKLEVLKDISISIDAGDFLILLGPSGCGKSTLLSLIAGLDNISKGEIRIGGRVVNELPSKDRDIAMVFQSYALYPTMTVKQNIEFGMKVRGVPKPDRAKAIEKVASLLQIEALLDRRSSQLSGGQRQRVAIGRALVRSPKLFLFDEPLSNLDAKLRDDMRTEIKKLHQRLGTTIVYVTHDQIEAMTLGTKVAVMRQGRVQQLADPETLYNFPNSVYVARFVGSPAMNIFKGKLVQNDEGQCYVQTTRGEEGSIDIGPIKVSAASAAAYRNKDVLVGIRPEHFHAAEAGGHSMRIDIVEPTGPDALAFFNLGGTEIIARLRPRSVRAGAASNLLIEVDKTLIFDPSSEDRIL